MGDEKGSYSVFDHTADIGLEVRAPSRATLYEASALALFDVMFEWASSGTGNAIALDVAVRADNQEELLVRWLSELVFLYDTKGLVLEEVSVSVISTTTLKAVVRGRPYDESVHVLKTEVKAITYHELAVRGTGQEWFARFVIDV